MAISDPNDALLEMEQQIASIAVRMLRLRETIAALEAEGAYADDHIELLAALGAAQSRLIEHRERLARGKRERG